MTEGEVVHVAPMSDDMHVLRVGDDAGRCWCKPMVEMFLDRPNVACVYHNAFDGYEGKWGVFRVEYWKADE